MFELAAAEVPQGTDGVALIASQYEVLHFDEVPILFTGVNQYGGRIIGSFLERDESTAMVRTVNALVDDGTFGKFLRRAMTYRDILDQAGILFFIDRMPEPQKKRIRAGRFKDIPEQMRPTDESFCPPREYEGSLEYVAVLHGPSTAEHRAESGVVVSIAQNVGRLIREAVTSLMPTQGFEVDLALEAASFDMRFRVQIPEALQFKENALYVKEYVDFCLNHFHAEAQQVARKSVEDAPRFKRLLDLRTGGGALSENQLKPLVSGIERSIRALNELSQIIGNRLTSVQVFTDDQTLVGTIDERGALIQEQALEAFDSIAHSVETDASPTKYEILVYSLNKETRKGSAYVLSAAAKEMPKAKIEIAGADSLDQSPFTQSIDQSVRITVLGRATRRDGAVTKLHIDTAEPA